MMASLRLRLAIGAVVAIAVVLALVWYVLGHLFEDYLAEQYSNEMIAITDTLGARLAVQGSGLKLNGEPSDPRFQIPAGGRYWQVSTAGGQPPLRSRSLWDQELADEALSANLYLGFQEADGPDGNAILVLVKDLSIGDGPGRKPFKVYTAFSKAEMETALESYHRPLRLMLSATGALLLLAAFLQSVIGLRPLARLQQDVAAIRAGRSAHIGARGPSEVMPLVSEINLLLTERETAVERARARASDLAHGLKTPLTVLSHLLEDLPWERQETARKQIDLIRQRADRQLQAARMGVEQMATTSVLGIAGKLVNVLQPITDDRKIAWSMAIDPSITVQTDPADIAEALGNVLDNAVRFAQARISISAARDGAMVTIRVGDDGPGVAPGYYPDMLKRGESTEDSGSGLGLAISNDIAAAYGGTLELRKSPLGGLEVALRLPASRSVNDRL